MGLVCSVPRPDWDGVIWACTKLKVPQKGEYLLWAIFQLFSVAPDRMLAVPIWTGGLQVLCYTIIKSEVLISLFEMKTSYLECFIGIRRHGHCCPCYLFLHYSGLVCSCKYIKNGLCYSVQIVLGLTNSIVTINRDFWSVQDNRKTHTICSPVMQSKEK